MRLVLAAFFVILFAGQSVDAQTQSFPYEAVVKTDQVEILSGVDFYATEKLKRGTRVMVHRHDPGGWYVIDPPSGSFSWIRADYVQVTGSRTGTLTESNVMVRVGSTLSDDRDVYQEKLYKGDRVEILGERTFQTEDGKIRLFKIVPPKGERRWISGKHVVSLNEFSRLGNNPNTFTAPPENKSRETFATQSQPSSKSKATQKKLTVTRKNEPFSAAVPQSPEFVQKLEKLEELDQHFRSMVKLDAGQWNLDQLESDYRKLQKESADTDVEYQVDQRLAAVKRYRIVKNEYDEFVKITTETTKKDRQLLAVLNQKTEKTTTPAVQPVQPAAPVLRAPRTNRISPVPTPIPFGSRTSVYRSRTVPAPFAGPSLRPVPHPASQLPRQVTQAHSKQKPLFDGAGIIQRASYRLPGAPRHVLIDSQGHVLAYLKGRWGVSLDRYLGHSVGINGPKMFRPDLRTNLIRVHAIRPVQLSK